QEGRRLLRAARAQAAGPGRHRRPLPRQELTHRPDAMPEKPETAAALSLLSADAVRQRAHRLLAIGLADGLAHFRIDLGRLDTTADLVVETTRAAYPSLEVPFHSRWRHFAVGGS